MIMPFTSSMSFRSPIQKNRKRNSSFEAKLDKTADLNENQGFVSLAQSESESETKFSGWGHSSKPKKKSSWGNCKKH
jgi:hypothetical protein